MVHQLNWLILYQSFTRLYLLVPLMHYDLRYPRSLILIWIIPIECSLRQCQAQTCPERKKERLKVSKGKKTPTRGSVVDYFFKCNQVSPVKTHHSTADYKSEGIHYCHNMVHRLACKSKRLPYMWFDDIHSQGRMESWMNHLHWAQQCKLRCTVK